MLILLQTVIVIISLSENCDILKWKKKKEKEIS